MPVSPPSRAACSCDRLPVAGLLPPVARRLARGRDHAGHEHQGVDREPGGDQRRGEPAERLADDDQVPAVADGGDHRVGVVVELERVVVAGQVGSHHVVPARAQLGLDQVPVPADVAGAVDQDEGAHGGLNGSGERTPSRAKMGSWTSG